MQKPGKSRRKPHTAFLSYHRPFPVHFKGYGEGVETRIEEKKNPPTVFHFFSQAPLKIIGPIMRRIIQFFSYYNFYFLIPSAWVLPRNEQCTQKREGLGVAGMHGWKEGE